MWPLILTLSVRSSSVSSSEAVNVPYLTDKLNDQKMFTIMSILYVFLIYVYILMVVYKIIKETNKYKFSVDNENGAKDKPWFDNDEGVIEIIEIFNIN